MKLKMKKLALLFIFSCSIVLAQEPITTNLGDFTTLKVFNGLTVELQKSTTSKIVITGPKSDDVSIKNSDGTLKIRLKFPDSFTADGVKIVLFYSKEIAILDANEGANIVSDEIIKQQHLEVKVQEGAAIDLKVNANYLEIKSVSGGIISLTGVTKNQNIEANTGGIYKAFDLESEQTIANSASGAIVEVKASDLLDAKAQFGGSIYYKGSPKVIKSKTVIKGTIKSMN